MIDNSDLGNVNNVVENGAAYGAGPGRKPSPRQVNSGASNSHDQRRSPRLASSSQLQFSRAQNPDDGSDDDVWVCKLCQNEFDQPEDKLVMCSRCDSSYCIACLRMPDSHYQVLSKDPGLHWYCPDCKQSALHAVRDDFEIEERCEAFFSKCQQE